MIAFLKLLINHFKHPVTIGFIFYVLIFFTSSCGNNRKEEHYLSPQLVIPITEKNITSLVFSPDNTLILANGSHLWDVKTGKLIRVFEGYTSSFSPDGRIIATCNYGDSTVRLYEAKSGLLIREFKEHTGDINKIEFLDYKTIRSFDDKVCLVWKADTGDVLEEQKIMNREFGKTLNWVIQYSRNYDTVKITDRKGRMVFNSFFDVLNNLTFSNDGRKISGFIDGEVKIFDLSSQKITSIKPPDTYSSKDYYKGFKGPFVWAPNDRYLFTVEDISGWSQSIHSTLIRLYDSEQRQFIKESELSGSLNLKFSIDQRYLVIASENSLDYGSHEIYIWDSFFNNLKYSIREKSVITSFTISNDSRYLATATLNGQITIREIETGGVLMITKGIRNEFYNPQFTDNGNQLIRGQLYGSDDTLFYYRVHAFDLETGLPTYTLENSIKWQIYSFESNKNHIFLPQEKSFSVWNSGKGKLIKTIEIDFDKSHYLFLSPRGNYCYIGGDSSSHYLIKMKPLGIVREIKHRLYYPGYNGFMSFNEAEDKYLMLDSNEVTIYDLQSGKELNRIKNDSLKASCYFLNDQVAILDYGENKSILWNFSLETTKIIERLNPFTISKQNQIISLKKNTLNIYNQNLELLKQVNTGTALAEWRAPELSPDGRYCFVQCSNNLFNEDQRQIKIFETTNWNCIVTDKAFGNPMVNWNRGIFFSEDSHKIQIKSIFNNKIDLTYYPLDSVDWVVTHPSGLFDASQGAMDKLYFVQGLDIIDFAQLKERYYEPGLWKKVMSGEKLREVAAFKSIELPPDVEQEKDSNFGVANLKFKNREGGIGPISVTLNGLEVMEDIRPSGFNPKKKSWEHELKLSALPNLKKGEENLIEIRAWNEGHWVISRPLQIKFTPASTRGATAEIEESKENKPIPNIHILTCGVSDYTGNAIDLKYATKDAESMAKALQLGASKLVGTGKTFVYSLTDKSTLKPTKANIQKTFQEISKKSSPNDVFVVYLSGHGINWGGDNGDFYYLTSDAYSTELQAYNDPAIRTNATISSKELIELFKTVPSDKRVLMIDACASGKMVQNLVASRDISSSTLRALDRLRDRTGFHIITGCAADAVSYEASRFGQGVLTYSLIEGIKGASLKENKFVDINMLFQHAKERVPELAKGIGGIQSPQVFSPQGAQSFDIGELDDEIKKQIPLPKTRPVFVRSTFIDDNALIDAEDLGAKLDEALNDLSAKGEKAPILFMDLQKYDGGCSISGKYKKVNGLISLTYKVRCDGKEKVMTVTGKTAEEVVLKVIAGLE